MKKDSLKLAKDLPQVTNWITDYVRITDNTEPPVNFRKWCAISAIAAVLQRKCFLEWGEELIFPNMYIVLISPPGKARKGTAMRPILNMLRDCEVPMSAESATREALIKQLEEINELADNGYHSSLTVVSPELTVFLGYAQNNLVSTLTDWFDCASVWQYNTKNKGTNTIQGVYINLLGATTPDAIRQSLPTDAIGGGLTSRIVFVYEERKGKTIAFPSMTQEEKLMKQALFQRLQQIKLLKGRFKASSGFVEDWAKWYLVNDEKNPFGRNSCKALESYIQRRPLQILKLSMIYRAAKDDSMILTSADLSDAISTLEDAEKKMPYTFMGIGSGQFAELTNALILYMRDRFETGMTFQEIVRLSIFDGGKDAAVNTIQSLLAAGMVRQEINSSGEQRFYLNY